MKLTQVVGSVYHLQFPSRPEMASTLVRFQEHYESPKFRGLIFSHEEFKSWYTKRNGKFTYLTDWSGFNIPSSVFAPFKTGRFDPLTREERDLLDLVSSLPEPFYLIATDEGGDVATMRHEIAHGLYTTNSHYRTEVYMLLEGCQLAPLHRMLYSNYHPAVWLDECHAYLISDYKEMRKSGTLKNDDLSDISVALIGAFEHYTDGKFQERV